MEYPFNEGTPGQLATLGCETHIRGGGQKYLGLLDCPERG
jgi:hypothetical protein